MRLKIIYTTCGKTCVVIGLVAKSTKDKGGEKRGYDGGKKEKYPFPFFKVKKTVFFTRKLNFIVLWIHTAKNLTTVFRTTQVYFIIKNSKHPCLFSHRKRSLSLSGHDACPTFCS